MTPALFGFAIALAVGMTGIGGGSFTVPALVIALGLPPGEAVGTAFVFAGVLRLVAAPFYLYERQFHSRYFRLLTAGAIPGLFAGMIALRWFVKREHDATLILALGIVLAASSVITFAPRMHNPSFTRNNSRWLPWLAFPIGVESGFSSAGAGALGSVLLLNYSEMTPAQVVGTDLVFGLVLATVGSAFQWTLGGISSSALLPLLAGGIPGVVLGCRLARLLPAQKLKQVVALIALFAGLQMVWLGSRSLVTRHALRRRNQRAALIVPKAVLPHAVAPSASVALR
jgi:uncharacterized membrane protein YfcA